MNNEKVLILSASNYDFKDDSTGKQIKGVTVWLLPLNSQDSYTNGIKPVKYSLPYDLTSLFDDVALPAYAEMEFTFDFSRSRIMPKTFNKFIEMEVGELVE